MSSSLEGRTAVVTGASSGIGRAIALAAAKRGADVCVVGRREKELRALARSGKEMGRRMHVYLSDLSSENDFSELAEVVERQFGGMQVLVHSAGIHEVDSVETRLWVQQFRRQFAVNVCGPAGITRACLPMLKAAEGDIVFVNSSIVMRARPGLTQYKATKHALMAVADSVREEVNGLGVRVLSIFPGRTATPMQERIRKEEGRDFPAERLLQPEDIAETVLAALCLPRRAEVTEIHIRPTRPG